MDPRERKVAFDLDKITFEWVQETNNVKQLKKALKALKDDGGWYEKLEKAIEDKIQALDPKPKAPSNVVSAEEQKLIESDISSFVQQYSPDNLSQEENNKRKAEQEKTKGNDYMRSQDFQQALECYTQALKLDNQSSAVLCNRALTYIKLKKYEEAIQDANQAIKLDPQYIKAYHRRGTANMQLKNYQSALKDLQFVQKNNQQKDAQLSKDIEFLEQNCKFKRIEIEEDSEDENESESISQQQKVTTSSQDSNQQASQQSQNQQQPSPPQSQSKIQQNQVQELKEDQKVQVKQSLNEVPNEKVQQNLTRMDQKKEEGNKLYSQGKFQEAIKKYEECLKQIQTYNPKDEVHY